MAQAGDASKVDMSVGDIYGQNTAKYEHLGLTSDLLACSFGKASTHLEDQYGYVLKISVSDFYFFFRTILTFFNNIVNVFFYFLFFFSFR